MSFRLRPTTPESTLLTLNNYEVEADAAGFKKAKRNYIPVSSEGRNFVDFVLVPRED